MSLFLFVQRFDIFPMDQDRWSTGAPDRDASLRLGLNEDLIYSHPIEVLKKLENEDKVCVLLFSPPAQDTG